MRALAISAFLAGTSAHAQSFWTYGPPTPEQSDAIKRAAVIVATSAVCRDVPEVAMHRPAHAQEALATLQKASVPDAETMIEAMISATGEEAPIEPGLAGVVCFVVLGKIR